MRNVTEETITEAFVNYFGDDTDARTREVMASLAKHLHAFARETRLTHDEWNKGLELLRWTGKITCLLYTSPSPRDGLLSRMPSSA